MCPAEDAEVGVLTLGPLSCVGPHLEIGDINKIYFIFYYVGTCGCVHWVSLELEL